MSVSSMVPRRTTYALACCVALSLAGCAQDEPVEYKLMDAAEQRIVFHAASFADAEPRIMGRKTRGSTEQYVVWDSGGAVAAFWHGATFPGKFWKRANEHQPERVLRRWKNMESAAFDLERAGVVKAPIGGVDYWRFRFEDRQDCYAINHFWTPSPGDQGGYREWISGYFCNPEGATLTDADIADMLSRIDVIKGGAGSPGSRRD